MTQALVVDASAALALLRAEPFAGDIRRALAGARRLIVPEHFWLEVANVLGRRHHWEAEAIVEAVRDLDELGIESVSLDRALLLAGVDIQHRLALTAYDAVYLALAEVEDAHLLTLDVRLAARAGSRAVPLPGLPRGLAEEPAGYGGEPVNWARFGPFLARLRADARRAG